MICRSLHSYVADCLAQKSLRRCLVFQGIRTPVLRATISMLNLPGFG